MLICLQKGHTTLASFDMESDPFYVGQKISVRTPEMELDDYIITKKYTEVRIPPGGARAKIDVFYSVKRG